MYSLHSLVAESLMYQTPYMHEFFQLSRCLLEQETQTNHLQVPRKGLIFVRSNDVIYGGPGFDFIYVHTWPLGISWGSDGHYTVDRCLRLKRTTSTTRALISILAAFVEARCVFIVFCSGGLAYTWQWRIGYKPQSTIFHIYCQSCRCYVTRSCFTLHY